MLNKRLNIVVSDETAFMLKEKAKLHKTTVGALIREGIDKVLGDADIERRVSAVKEISKIKMNLPQWEQLKKEDHRGIDDVLEDIPKKKESR